MNISACDKDDDNDNNDGWSLSLAYIAHCMIAERKKVAVEVKPSTPQHQPTTAGEKLNLIKDMICVCNNSPTNGT